VVTPEVPAGGSIRQAILDDQADGHLLHAACVEAPGQGQVGQIDGEAATTVAAAMAGERDQQIDGTVGPGIAEVAQGTGRNGIAAGAGGAVRAAAGREVTAPADEARRREVLDAGNAFGAIGDILAGSKHGRLLPNTASGVEFTRPNLAGNLH
jgi:hypothetical protein